MKILFLIRLFWPHGGGVERHVLEVGKRLVEKGHKVTVVTEEVPISKSPPSRSPFGHLGGAESTKYQTKAQSAKSVGSVFGIDIVRHNFGREDWFKKFRIWVWLWQNRYLIQQADVVHAHDVFFWYLPFRFLYSRKPVYTTFHGYETKFPPAKKAIFVRKLSEKLSFGNICVGDFIEKWYGTKPTYVTYGGVDVHLGRAMASQAQPVTIRGAGKKLNIVFIGRLEEDIGIQIYLRVLDELKKRDIPFEITFLGDGNYKHEASKYGEVTTRHYNDTYHYSELLGNASIIFASSYLSILSVMAQKRLVVAVYDNPLKEDYLEMAPFAKWIVVGNSPQKLAEKITYFQKHNSEKDKLTSAGFNWVKEQTWNKVTDLYFSLWNIK